MATSSLDVKLCKVYRTILASGVRACPASWLLVASAEVVFRNTQGTARIDCLLQPDTLRLLRRLLPLAACLFLHPTDLTAMRALGKELKRRGEGSAPPGETQNSFD